MKKGIYIILLQIAVLIYTSAGMLGKFAASEELFSLKFFLFYGFELLALGIYAIVWQQLISKIDLSIAYANRSINLLWALLFAFFIFKEQITLPNILGVIIVIIGISLVNSSDTNQKKNSARISSSPQTKEEENLWFQVISFCLHP